jgi:membrane associated rhomboid family serine protease
MLYYRYNKGPHGRMNRHGGRRPGLTILGIIGLIYLAPVILAATFGVCIGVFGIIGGLITAASEILSSLPEAAYSVGGVFIGILIGLILYNRNRDRKNASAESQEAEAYDSDTQEDTYDPTETYRHYGA